MIDEDSFITCRTLESLFDSKLSSFSRLVAPISCAGPNDDLDAGPSWHEVESEVEDLLEKVCLLFDASVSWRA